MTISAVRLNHAVLFVSDLERALDFYIRAFGTEVVAREPRANAAFLRMPGSEQPPRPRPVRDRRGRTAAPARDGRALPPGLAGRHDRGPRAGPADAARTSTPSPASPATAPPRASTASTRTATSSRSCGCCRATSWGEFENAAPIERARPGRRGTPLGRPSVRRAGSSRTSEVTTFGEPVATYRGSTDPDAPLVVLLHGRGSDEQQIATLADHLPAAPGLRRGARADRRGRRLRLVRQPRHRPAGRRVARRHDGLVPGLARTPRPPAGRWCWSGSAAARRSPADCCWPTRRGGRAPAILLGTLPFDAGVPTDAGRLDGVRVLVAQGDADTVIPRELLDRTWSYLHDSSGATLTAHRDPGGHGISAATLAVLVDWLTATA